MDKNKVLNVVLVVLVFLAFAGGMFVYNDGQIRESKEHAKYVKANYGWSVNRKETSLEKETGVKASGSPSLFTDYSATFDDAVRAIGLYKLDAQMACWTMESEWSDAIYDGDGDFEKAIREYRRTARFKECQDELGEADEELKGYIEILKKAPKKYDDAFDHLLDAYTVWYNLADHGMNPSGSLLEYRSKTDDLSDELDRHLQKAKLLKP